MISIASSFVKSSTDATGAYHIRCHVVRLVSMGRSLILAVLGLPKGYPEDAEISVKSTDGNA